MSNKRVYLILSFLALFHVMITALSATNFFTEEDTEKWNKEVGVPNHQDSCMTSSKMLKPACSVNINKVYINVVFEKTFLNVEGENQ